MCHWGLPLLSLGTATRMNIISFLTASEEDACRNRPSEKQQPQRLASHSHKGLQEATKACKKQPQRLQDTATKACKSQPQRLARHSHKGLQETATKACITQPQGLGKKATGAISQKGLGATCKQTLFAWTSRYAFKKWSFSIKEKVCWCQVHEMNLVPFIANAPSNTHRCQAKARPAVTTGRKHSNAI